MTDAEDKADVVTSTEGESVRRVVEATGEELTDVDVGAGGAPSEIIRGINENLDEVRGSVSDHSEGYDIPSPPVDGEQPQEGEVEAKQALTAFLVIIEHDGSTYAVTDYGSLPPIAVSKMADSGDIYGACMRVSKDVQNLEIYQGVVNQMAMIGKQMQDQQTNQRIMQQAGLIGPDGGPMLNRKQRRHPG